jgi:hypothetical protein
MIAQVPSKPSKRPSHHSQVTAHGVFGRTAWNDSHVTTTSTARVAEQSASSDAAAIMAMIAAVGVINSTAAADALPGICNILLPFQGTAAAP